MNDSWPVVLEDVSYSIGAAQLVRAVSMNFAANGMNVILGPNGAGKSTLMRIAAGRLSPTAGRVTYGDDDVRTIEPRALALRRAFLSQHVEIDFAITVEEVVLMGRYPHFSGTPSAHDREVVHDALRLVGMTSRCRQAYPTLSGGEQQKVQLARVLAQIWGKEDKPIPRILFLDEPTASLDIHYQLHILDIARSFLQRNCTIVMTLHDLNLAAEYGDRFFLMHQGMLVHVAEGRENLARDTLERVFDVRTRMLADERGNVAFRFFL
jgi:iron complex transport system ATP-binding protein